VLLKFKENGYVESLERRRGNEREIENDPLENVRRDTEKKSSN
jgi:hypothetical protein